jgi:hypothetical protein
MKDIKFFLYTVLFVLIPFSVSFATDITVYSESGYSDNTFMMRIFADIDDDIQGPLVSAGVKLTYPKGKLANPVAEKNKTTWYIGSSAKMYNYVEPDTEEEGEIVLLLGKLDIATPDEGVSENRILLATVTFDRIQGSSLPDQEDFNLMFAKSPPYTNFATSKGVDLDNKIIFNSLNSVDTSAVIFLRDSVRALKVMSCLDQEIPARSSELDIDNNQKVEMTEAVFNLKKGMIK